MEESVVTRGVVGTFFFALICKILVLLDLAWVHAGISWQNLDSKWVASKIFQNKELGRDFTEARVAARFG